MVVYLPSSSLRINYKGEFGIIPLMLRSSCVCSGCLLATCVYILSRTHEDLVVYLESSGLRIKRSPWHNFGKQWVFSVLLLISLHFYLAFCSTLLESTQITAMLNRWSYSWPILAGCPVWSGVSCGTTLDLHNTVVTGVKFWSDQPTIYLIKMSFVPSIYLLLDCLHVNLAILLLMDLGSYGQKDVVDSHSHAKKWFEVVLHGWHKKLNCMKKGVLNTLKEVTKLLAQVVRDVYIRTHGWGSAVRRIGWCNISSSLFSCFSPLAVLSLLLAGLEFSFICLVAVR